MSIESTTSFLTWLGDAFWYVLPVVVIVGIVMQTSRMFRERDVRFPSESRGDLVHQENGSGRVGIDIYNLGTVRLALYRDRFVFSAAQNRFEVPLSAITSIGVTEGLVRPGIKIRFLVGADHTVVFVPKDLPTLIARFEDVGVRIAA